MATPFLCRLDRVAGVMKSLTFKDSKIYFCVASFCFLFLNIENICHFISNLFPLSNESSVKSLKEDIMRIIDGKGKDIRLIASGKILKPESALIEDFKLGVCL